MEAVPFELAGMTATCGTGVELIDCAGFDAVTVPSETTTGGVAVLDRGAVVVACGEVVVACDAVLFACDAAGFSDTRMSATSTGALACDMMMPIRE
jgi:hypothetical protein